MYRAFADGDNLFSTSIFVLVSAVQKLSRFTRIPLGTLLYRGLGGKMDLPDIFFEVDGNGCSGYAEWGFLSTSSDRDVALCDQLVMDCGASEDFIEGRRAFMEKRKPVFKGR